MTLSLKKCYKTTLLVLAFSIAFNWGHADFVALAKQECITHVCVDEEIADSDIVTLRNFDLDIDKLNWKKLALDRISIFQKQSSDQRKLTYIIIKFEKKSVLLISTGQNHVIIHDESPPDCVRCKVIVFGNWNDMGPTILLDDKNFIFRGGE